MYNTFILTTQISNQYHRVHSSLPLFLPVISFSVSEKPGSHYLQCIYLSVQGFPGGLVVKNLLANAGDAN